MDSSERVDKPRCQFRVRINGKVARCELKQHPKYDSHGNRTNHFINDTVIPHWMEEYQHLGKVGK